MCERGRENWLNEWGEKTFYSFSLSSFALPISSVLYLALFSLSSPLQKYIVLKDFSHILGNPSWHGVLLVRALSALGSIQSVSSSAHGVRCMLRAARSCISASGDIHPP